MMLHCRPTVHGLLSYARDYSSLFSSIFISWSSITTIIISNQFITSLIWRMDKTYVRLKHCVAIFCLSLRLTNNDSEIKRKCLASSYFSNHFLQDKDAKCTTMPITNAEIPKRANHIIRKKVIYTRFFNVIILDYRNGRSSLDILHWHPWFICINSIIPCNRLLVPSP